MAGWSAGDLPENGSPSNIGVIGPWEGMPSWSDLLKRSYKLFRERFEEYFPLLLSVGIVAGAACYGLDQLRILLTTITVHPSVFDEPSRSFYFRGKSISWLLWCSQVLVIWIAITFTFACVAAKVLGAANEPSRKTIPASQAVRSIMIQFHKIVVMALLGALATILFSTFVLPLLLRTLPFLAFFLRFDYQTYLVAYSVVRGLVLIIFGALLSKMAPAIPNLVDSPGQSLRDAVRIGLAHTRGRQSFLCLWLGASAACGGLVYFAAADTLQAACSHGSMTPGACSLLLTLLAVVMITQLAGPAFICFSLLYFESNLREQASLAGPAR